MEIILLAAVFLLPAVGAYLVSRKTYTVLKKKPSKWALAAAIPAFLATYTVTFFAIVWALAHSLMFHR